MDTVTVELNPDDSHRLAAYCERHNRTPSGAAGDLLSRALMSDLEEETARRAPTHAGGVQVRDPGRVDAFPENRISSSGTHGYGFGETGAVRR